MLLAVDVRNGSANLGFRAGGAWLSVTRLGVSPERSADEYAFLLEAALGKARAQGQASAVSEVWLSSVVPAVTPRFVAAAESVCGVEVQVVGPGTRTGVKIRTDFPSEVGSDLVCAAAAARELAGSPCLVADFGAVLTISAIDASGDLVGAAFAPGLWTAAEALRAHSAQLPEVRLVRPLRAIGRSTAQSVQSGVLVGYGGLVARLAERMSAELRPEGPPVPLVGTGDEDGRALLAAEGLGRFVPDLVLEGIAIVAARKPRE